MLPTIVRDPGETTDPAMLAYPPTLPLEVAMKTAPIRAICEAYHLSEDEWRQLRVLPMFQADVRAAQEMLRRDGMGFVVKARLQAEELLKTSWHLIHNTMTPPSVRADLIKFTIRASGLDQSVVKAAEAEKGNTLNIQINLG